MLLACTLTDILLGSTAALLSATLLAIVIDIIRTSRPL